MAHEITKILITTPNMIIARGKELAGNMPSLKKNQLVQARVIKNLSPNKAQLLIFGRKLLAKTHTQINAGEKITLRVVKTQPNPIFKVEPSENDPTKTLYDTLKPLGRQGPFKYIEKIVGGTGRTGDGKAVSHSSKIVESFIRLVRFSALKSGEADPSILGNLIKSSGMQWERKLFSIFFRDAPVSQKELQEVVNWDLKGMAAKINSTKEYTAGKEFFNKFIEATENLQALNRVTLEESGRLLMIIPTLFGMKLNFGQLLIDLNSKGNQRKQDGRVLRISFLLELSQVGDFLADFSLLKNRINGFFCVATREIQKLVENNIPALKEKLRSHDFEVHSLDCRVAGPEILAGTSLLDTVLSGSVDGLLNIVI